MTRSLTAVSASWLSTFRAIPAMACSLLSVTFAMAPSMPRVTLSSYHARDCQTAATRATATPATSSSSIFEVITSTPPLYQPNRPRRQSQQPEISTRSRRCNGAYVAKHLRRAVPQKHHVIERYGAGQGVVVVEPLNHTATSPADPCPCPRPHARTRTPHRCGLAHAP